MGEKQWKSCSRTKGSYILIEQRGESREMLSEESCESSSESEESITEIKSDFDE